MKAWQVGVTNVGATSAATTAWRSGGQLRVTVIVKSAFAFVPNETMLLTKPDPIIDTDAGVGSDRYPFRPRVDVIFVGHAYAPGGTPAKRIPARIAIASANEKSLDKVIDVIGDRQSPHADPVPFTKMPITYERAYGGPGFDGNPAGAGFGPNAHIMPNLVYPQGWQRDTESAALGPISASSPRRRQLAGNQPLDFLTKTVTEIPPHVNVSYFQCAPEDQRIGQLNGDEWILLENLHPTHPRLMMRLPDVKGAAMIFGDDGVDTPITMRADTLLIDSDREVCVLTCRGSHPVPNEAALDRLRIAAGVESKGIPIDWADVKKKVMAPANAGATTAVLPGTAVLDANAPIELKAPYAVAEPRKADVLTPATAAAPIPGAPFAVAAAGDSSHSAAAPVHVPSPVGPTTFVLHDPAPVPPDFNALPFVKAPASANALASDATSALPAAATPTSAAALASDATMLPDAGFVDQTEKATPADANATTAMPATRGNVLTTTNVYPDAAPPTVDRDPPVDSPVEKEWSWATPEQTNSPPPQKSAAQSKTAARPAEPPARAVIYSGFSRKK